jgi:hypothetical protein
MSGPGSVRAPTPCYTGCAISSRRTADTNSPASNPVRPLPGTLPAAAGAGGDAGGGAPGGAPGAAGARCGREEVGCWRAAPRAAAGAGGSASRCAGAGAAGAGGSSTARGGAGRGGDGGETRRLRREPSGPARRASACSAVTPGPADRQACGPRRARMWSTATDSWDLVVLELVR